jgi:mannose-6-phosphate isomerase-like protein (cupin superfamily)
MNLSGLSAAVNTYNIYTRRKEECYEISPGNGEKIYELVGAYSSCKAKQHSVAHVDIASKGSSHAHFHPDAEESYIVMKGEGRLVINGTTRTVKAGEVAHIPTGAIHQIFNDKIEDLQFYCICSPAWVPEGSIPAKGDEKHEHKHEIYTKTREECFEISTGQGEKIYEFVGKGNGNANQQSVALVEIESAGKSSAHYHPVAEESYIITEGQGRLVIDGVTKNVTAGDVAFIPVGRVHQIFNDHKEKLKFFCICAPAWVPEGSVFV